MGRKLFQLGLMAAGLFGVAACTPPPDYLFVDPHVRPVRVALLKSFGVFEKHYERVPIADCSFFEESQQQGSVAGSYNEEIWRVTAASEGGVFELRYGQVPLGFVQSTPAAGSAPPLEPGHRYKVHCSGDTIGMAEFVVP
jgi:hypothetical protein